MKKIIILFIICGNLAAQYPLNVSTIKVNNSIKFSDNSVMTKYDTTATLATKYYSNVGSLNAINTSNDSIAALRSYINSKPANINSGFLYWNSATSSYKPYGVAKTWLSIDSSGSFPSNTTRMNLNGFVYMPRFYVNSSLNQYAGQILNTGIGIGLGITNSSTGKAFDLNSSGGTAISGSLSGTSKGIELLSTGSGAVANFSSSGGGVALSASSSASGRAAVISSSNNSSGGIQVNHSVGTGSAVEIITTNTATNALKINANGTTNTNELIGLYYKGTKVAAFDSTGHLEFTSTGTAWDDDNLDPTTLTGGGTAPSAISWASTNVKIASFVNAATDEVQGTREIPHRAKLASQITFHAHWAATTTNADSVRFGLEYFFSTEGVAVTSSTTIYAMDKASGTAWAKKSTNFAPITIPNELGAQFHFRFFRDGTDIRDTFTGDAAVSTIGYHYEIDGLGSRQITTK